MQQVGVYTETGETLNEAIAAENSERGYGSVPHGAERRLSPADVHGGIRGYAIGARQLLSKH